MLIAKSYADQIEWPGYFRATQDEKLSQSSLYILSCTHETLFFALAFESVHVGP